MKQEIVFPIITSIAMAIFGFLVNDIKSDIERIDEKVVEMYGRVEALRAIQNQGIVGVEKPPKEQYAR